MESPQMDTIEMVKAPVTFLELGQAAEGKIEIKDTQRERLQEFTERVGSGEFHVITDERMPCGCIDGRHGCSLKPNTAGGTQSLMVADDLINKQFAANDGTTRGAYRNVLNFLKKAGKRFGGHTAEHKAESGSGCGANDELAKIYDIMHRKGDAVRMLAAQIGVNVDDDTHQLIMKNAVSRESFSAGAELLDDLEEAGGEKSVDKLEGGHNEVLIVVNTRFGTTLDRDALRVEFGNDYQAFNVDVWAFEEGAKTVSIGEEEQRRKIIAMAYYNIATALTLCGQNMRVVVL